MKRYTILLMMLGVLLIVASCSEDRITTPEQGITTFESGNTLDPELVAAEIILGSGWEFDEKAEASQQIASGTEQPGMSRHMLSCEREHIVGDVYHYSWNIRIGCGTYDVIGLHRVVKERAPNRPIRARNNIFMLNGDMKNFVGCFMPGLVSFSNPDEFGIAAHLAEQDIDVWGMDQAYNAIPAGETDFSFMAEWGMLKHVDDTNVGLTIARIIRLFTGSGFRKMNLLGYSGGSALAFAVANNETQRPRGLRNVGGLIPVDQALFSDDSDYDALWCATSQYYAELIAGGDYAEPNAFPMFGEPARDDPDGPSALLPGFTNLQAAMAIAVYPYFEGYPLHFLAGIFDEYGLPTGLQYTDLDLWIDFLCYTPAYFPNAFSRDELLSRCGATPWTDHLAEIEIPVYLVLAGGGIGEGEAYTLDFLGSTDITTLTVALYPPEEAALDFGHVDLFTAANAPELVWDQIAGWIQEHSNHHTPDPPYQIAYAHE